MPTRRIGSDFWMWHCFAITCKEVRRRGIVRSSGQHPLSPHTIARGYTGSSPTAYRFARDWQERTDIAGAFLVPSPPTAKRMKKWADEKRRPLKFKEGDKVMVKVLPQVFRKVHKGLVRRYESPFPVVKKESYTGI